MKRRIRKGEFGYIRSQKIIRTWITIGLMAAPLLVFFTGLFINNTRNSIFTVVAVVGCIPACKSAVTAIMMFLQKPMLQETYNKISAHVQTLTAGYELVISAYEKQTYINSVVVVGNTVAGYTEREKADASFVEKHIQQILKQNGYSVSVKIFKDLKPYLERLDGLNERADSMEKDIIFVPNETYPDLTRNELILHTIYAISL